jgi:hypothetical protein
MPLFTVSENRLSPVPQTNFLKEKALQHLIESNLDTVFKCRFIATEFSTGEQHGRIDSLALSEENNPVIIEYKKAEASHLIAQSLFYLSWIRGHHGDFEVAARRALGPTTEVDWSDIRVICISPGYSKYDLPAASELQDKLELWEYRLYGNGVFVLEKARQGEDAAVFGKSAVMVAAGKKAAITRATATFTFEEHLQGKPAAIRELALAVNEYVTGLDSQIEAAPKKSYVVYRTSQSIVFMSIQQEKILLELKLDPRRPLDPREFPQHPGWVRHTP